MSSKGLTGRSVPELADDFLALSLAKGEAVMAGQNAKANRLHFRVLAVREELRSRPDDQRRALFALYNHPNPQVRFESAMATLVLLPNESRAALQMIIDRGEFPQALDAGLTLLYMSDGRFVPE